MAARLATLAHGQRKDYADEQTGKSAALPEPVTQTQAADLLNVGERSVRSAAQVRDFGSPEMQADVEEGRLPVSRSGVGGSSGRRGERQKSR